MALDKSLLISELQYKAVRSSGAGGQNVNKVSSKVELSFDLENSSALSESQKQRLAQKWENKLTKESVLMLQCDTHRSQHRNKEEVTQRFLELVVAGLKKPKKRIATKPTKSSQKKRMDQKTKHSEKKGLRKPPEL